MRVKRALVSVTNKQNIVLFCRLLVHEGVEIISTGGTARQLRDAEHPVAVTEVGTVTNFPEMLDGRVKTLHPKIAAGILAVRDNPRHMAQIVEKQIKPIDMVVVNLYDFQGAVERRASRDELVENIDIGGPTMIRAAAKNWQDVAVVTDPNDYDSLIGELREGHGQLSLKTLWRLAQKAFVLTAEYDAYISATLALLNHEGRSLAANPYVVA